MTFNEKSQWIMLVGLLIAFGIFFQSSYAVFLAVPEAKDIIAPQAFLFMAATAMLVVILVVGHIVIFMFSQDDATDERDQLIELKGERYGSWVLATGVFFTLCTAVYTEGNAVTAHVLLGFWVLAQMVENLSQIIMYRRSS
jgi:hypothetical protein